MPIYKTEKQKNGKAQYKVVVNYTDSYGNHKSKAKRVYGLSEAKLAEMEMSSSESNSKLITLDELFLQMQKAKKTDVRQTSAEKTERNYKRYIQPSLGKKRIDKLNSVVLQNWKNEISERDLSIRTCQNIYKELHAILQFGCKIEYLNRNPLNNLGNFKNANDFEKPQDKLQYYTVEQWKQYIIGMDEVVNDSLISRGCRIFFFIAYFTGMRKGEINALTWNDIEDNLIHITKSVSQKVKGVPFLITPPKNKSSYRDIQIPIPLLNILDEWKKELGKDYKKTNYICGGLTPIRDTVLSDFNFAVAKAAELPHIRIHDFRHSHASLLCNNGINIQEVSRRLGHSKIEMTWNTYSHLYPREEERALSVLNDIKI